GVRLRGADRPGAVLDRRHADGGVDRGAVRLDPVVDGVGALAAEPEHTGVEDADLLAAGAVHGHPRAPTAAALELDERVTRDLLGEPGAPLAEDAPVPVEQDLGGDGQRLGEGPLRVVEPAGAPAVAHRLV